MQNTRTNTRQLVMLSLFSAIIIAMTAIPQIGYITYGLISITTIHVPVIIAAIILGPTGGIVVGIVWGVTSLVKAITMGTLETAIFINPLISVLPRAIVGAFAGFLAVKLEGLITQRVARYSLIAFAATLANTVLVISAMGLFGSNIIVPLGDTLLTIFGVLFGINGIVELALAILTVPIIVNALKSARRDF